MFARQSIFRPEQPGSTFSGAVHNLVIETPVNPSSVPVPKEETPIPARPSPHVSGRDYLHFVSSLKPESKELRERQSVLLGEADALRQEINALADAIESERLSALHAQRETLRAECRQAEDSLAAIQREEGTLRTRLNEVSEKVGAKTARWKEVKDCRTASRFPTDAEKQKVREIAEKARLGLVEAQQEAAKVSQDWNAWEHRRKLAAQKLDELSWELMKVEAAISGKPLHDPETALKAIPSPNMEGQLKSRA